MKRIEDRPEFYSRIQYVISENYDLSELENAAEEYQNKKKQVDSDSSNKVDPICKADGEKIAVKE